MNPEVKEQPVETIMQPAFPFVDISTPVELLADDDHADEPGRPGAGLQDGQDVHHHAVGRDPGDLLDAVGGRPWAVGGRGGRSAVRRWAFCGAGTSVPADQPFPFLDNHELIGGHVSDPVLDPAGPLDLDRLNHRVTSRARTSAPGHSATRSSTRCGPSTTACPTRSARARWRRARSGSTSSPPPSPRSTCAGCRHRS